MTFRSRWGYHPCNFETFRKLKQLHRAYWDGRRLLAKWRRWNAKLPKNRTRPEPVIPAVLREICASTIAIEFSAARHGVPEPEQVRPLTLSAGQIDRWLEQLAGVA
jgi:hypothetical protein